MHAPVHSWERLRGGAAGTQGTNRGRPQKHHPEGAAPGKGGWSQGGSGGRSIGGGRGWWRRRGRTGAERWKGCAVASPRLEPRRSGRFRWIGSRTSAPHRWGAPSAPRRRLRPAPPSPVSSFRALVGYLPPPPRAPPRAPRRARPDTAPPSPSLPAQKNKTPETGPSAPSLRLESGVKTRVRWVSSGLPSRPLALDGSASLPDSSEPAGSRPTAQRVRRSSCDRTSLVRTSRLDSVPGSCTKAGG